ncbi:MAG: twin-arginine translocase TatA/TatE family subunit [Bdellovibrionales bacterium]|nr:twin-arginine translocase TatA/TatE family subunit [Bdellovibrionales bacterium]
MGEFSLSHWLIILVIVLIFVGPSKLPGLGKGLGEAIRGFKKGLNTDDDKNDVSDPNRQLNQSASARDTTSVKQDEKNKS